MIVYLVVFLILVLFIVYVFYGSGCPRSLRANFYGNYFAEDAVISEEDKPNSIESIQKCIDSGIGIKTELFATADRRAVVSAYNDLSKEYGIDKKISECDVDELEEIGILSLKKFVEIVDGQVPVILELKPGSNNESLCRYTADIIKTSGFINIGVTSFHSGIMAWFKEKEKKIFRGLTSAPSKDFRSLSKFDRFVTGNLMSNSVCRPHYILYRNKPQSILVKLAFALGMMKGVWTITDKAEGEKMEADKDIIICRGFIPEKIHFKDLPERVKTQAEINAEKKREEREARRNAREEQKLLQQQAKEERKARKEGTFAEKAEDAMNFAEEVIEEVVETIKETVESFKED